MFDFREVYHGYDFAGFSRSLDLLKAGEIPVKTKVRNMRNRMASNVVFRGNPAVLNTAGMASLNEEYWIYVKKAHLEEARELLCHL